MDLGLTIDTVHSSEVPFPRLAPVIRCWNRALIAGRGFVLVRGFPVDELEPAEIELAYVALGTHLGIPVTQNRTGDMLTSIADRRLDGPGVRLFKSRRAMDFHTDGVDLVGLLCVRPGHRGGASRLVSSGAVYNRMLQLRPDLVATLYEPFGWDRHNDSFDVSRPWDPYPPIRLVDGAPRIDYIGWDIRDAQRHPDVPPLTDAQRDAMELLEATIGAPDLQLNMTFDAGDLQILNDRLLLHARDEFEDPPAPAAGRMLLRLWLERSRRAVVT